MATTVKTIEISTALHAALRAVVPDDVAVYARGVPTDVDGNADEYATEVDRKLPMVDIIPVGQRPQFFTSSLRAFAFSLRAVSYGPEDPFQVSLYTIAQTIEEYLASAPALALTLVEFDALVVENEPDIGNSGDAEALQFLEWLITIHTRYTS